LAVVAVGVALYAGYRSDFSEARRRAGPAIEDGYATRPVPLPPETAPWQVTRENTPNVPAGQVPAWKETPPRPDPVARTTPPPVEPPRHLEEWAFDNPGGVDGERPPRPVPPARPPVASRQAPAAGR
jgi:hypothetical protein